MNNRCIMIYTDGGSRGNGSTNALAAWAYTLEFNGTMKYDKGGVIGATNNQMEMQAIIEALSAVKDKSIPVKLHSDSELCVKGMTQWLKGWKNNNWKNSKKETVENKHLWVQIDALISQFKSLEVIKVKGHSNVEGNILADKLVNEAMDELKEQLNSLNTSNSTIKQPTIQVKGNENNFTKIEFMTIISSILEEVDDIETIDELTKEMVFTICELSKLRKRFLKTMYK